MTSPHRSFAWIALAIVTVAIAAAVYVLPMPEPKASIVIDHATLLVGAAPGETIALPATLPPRGHGQPQEIRYRADFNLPELPGGNLFLLISSFERRSTVALNGHQIFDSGSQTFWSGPVVASPVMLQLPVPMLVAGRNELTMKTETGSILPTRLSRLYIGGEAALAPFLKLQLFLEQQLKTMAIAAHVILGVGILFVYFARSKDALFAWLAGLVAVSFVLSTIVYFAFQPDFASLSRYASTLAPVLGIFGLGMAFAVIGIAPPRALKIAGIAAPAVSMPLIFISAGVAH